MSSDDLPPELLGIKLAGNDFGPQELEAWFKDEKRGFYEVNESCHVLKHFGYFYDHVASNRFQARTLKQRHFETCLAFGCAGGDDVSSLPVSIGRYIAIE